MRCEEVLHCGDRRCGRFLHQPVTGVRHDDFVHVRCRIAHLDRYVGAESLLGADREHRHNVYEGEIVGGEIAIGFGFETIRA